MVMVSDGDKPGYTETAKALDYFQDAIEQMRLANVPEFNITAALTIILQGRGVSPQEYEDSFSSGCVIYDEFETYKIP